jgi:NAD(P)-dependent dehydrogenase (short-subunit alcohol dehydrogenase family)
VNLQLDGKLCLVTGSTKGIGLAVAKRLSAEGARVIVCGRSQAGVDAVRQTLGDPSRIFGIVSELSETASTSELLNQVQRIGIPDIVVHNVGFFELRPFFECDDEKWQAMFELNVMSGVRISRHLMPAMLARGTGRMVFVSSEQSLKPNPEMAHYAMSKTAQISIARSLAELTKGTSVTVNSVLVAPTWTEGVKTFLEPVAAASGHTIAEVQAEYFRNDGQSSLIQRFAQPEEIADILAFLCSPLSSAINGAALRADGGIIRSLF